MDKNRTTKERETRQQEEAFSEDELRDLAEDIVRYCPSLTHLLLALGSKREENPLDGLN